MNGFKKNMTQLFVVYKRDANMLKVRGQKKYSIQIVPKREQGWLCSVRQNRL